jgi:hypothetical protein
MSMKNVVMGIGIFVIYMLAMGYGIQAFYPQPEYDDYCDFRGARIPEKIAADPECNFPEGLRAKEEACWAVKGEFRYDYDDNGCVIGGYCDECRIAYDEANGDYGQKVFIIALIIGVLTFVVGYSILSVEPVGSALLASGIGAVFYGSIRNWQNLSNIWRFLLLLIALSLLIWIAMRLNKGKKKNS